MQLNLRSLLAHLSGSWKPTAGSEEAKQLQSAASRRLIQRIRAVIARRDLTIPLAPSGSAVDPNSIAEYLDGVLPSDRSTELEELCLASDKYLAEVAGCGEILDKIPECPVAPSSAYRRMYAQHREFAGGISEQPSPTHAWPSRRLRRVMTVIAAVLICVAFVYLGWERGFFDWNESSEFNGAGSALTSDHSGPPREIHLHTDAKTPIEPEVLKQATPGPPAKGISEPKSDPNRLGSLVAASEKLPTILLRKQPDNFWHVVPPASSISANDRLLGLPGFPCEISLDRGIRVHLLGNWPTAPPGADLSPLDSTILESAITLNSNAGVDLDLTLQRGRIGITNRKPQGEARVRVRFGREKWLLTLAEPESEAVLELKSFYSPGSPVHKAPAGEEPAAELRLLAIHGLFRLQVRYDSYSLHEPPGPAEFAWNNVGAISRRPQDLDRLPRWAEWHGRETIPQRDLSDEAQEAFVSFQTRLAGAPSVESVLHESLHNPDITTRVLAVYSLGAIDDLSSLLDALGNDRQFAQVRLAGFIALRSWIGRDAGNDSRLFAALEKKYSSATAEIVLHLLHGFSPGQLEKPEAYANLIGYLKHTDLPVRELSYRQLRTHVPEGRLIPYDPAGGRAQRVRAFEEWKKLIPEGTVPKS